MFLSVDPINAYSDPVGQFHRFRYADNNPYRFVDPDGRKASMLDHPGISASSVQGIAREPGNEAAPMPVADKKTISPIAGPSGRIDNKDKVATDTINSGLNKAQQRISASKNPVMINAWNRSSWRWDPQNPEFTTDPELAAFVNPSNPNSVVVGFKLAAFADSSMSFTYHNASFSGGRSAMVFAVLHEFGHVWTAGQGVPGNSRETMANKFAYGMLHRTDKGGISCIDCR